MMGAEDIANAEDPARKFLRENVIYLLLVGV
jgi:hypothetical protein